MAGKSGKMTVGSYDNITQQCPQMKKRLAPWAQEEVAAYLMMHYMRHERAAVAIEKARTACRTDATDRLLAYHGAAMSALGDIVSNVPAGFSLRDWHDAVDAMEAARRAGTEEAAGIIAEAAGVSTTGR